MGPSGSGKSTLMNLLGCLDTPTSGQYLLNNKDVSRMSDNELAEVRNVEIGFGDQRWATGSVGELRRHPILWQLIWDLEFPAQK